MWIAEYLRNKETKTDCIICENQDFGGGIHLLPEEHFFCKPGIKAKKKEIEEFLSIVMGYNDFPKWKSIDGEEAFNLHTNSDTLATYYVFDDDVDDYDDEDEEENKLYRQDDDRTLTIAQIERILTSYYDTDGDNTSGCSYNGRWLSIGDIMEKLSKEA